MPPLSITLGLGTLLAWPLLQLASVLVARNPRARMRRLVDELNADPRYGEDDRALLDREIAESRGTPWLSLAPLLVPVGLVAASVWELLGRDRPSRISDPNDGTRRAILERLEVRLGLRSGHETVERDHRFAEVRALAMQIGFIRSPTSTILTLLASLPTLPLYFLAYGARETAAILPRAARSVFEAVQMTTLGLRVARPE